MSPFPALALVYSTAEYGAPVWLNSPHTKELGCQLNITIRIISGTLKPTPQECRPKLSNITPPNLRRQSYLYREFNKMHENNQLPLHQDIQDPQGQNARTPPIALARQLALNFNIQAAWDGCWSSSGRSSPIFPIVLIERKKERSLQHETSIIHWTKQQSLEVDCQFPTPVSRCLVQQGFLTFLLPSYWSGGLVNSNWTIYHPKDIPFKKIRELHIFYFHCPGSTGNISSLHSFNLVVFGVTLERILLSNIETFVRKYDPSLNFAGDIVARSYLWVQV